MNAQSIKHGAIAEYGSFKSSEMSRVTKLDAGRDDVREYTLNRHSVGFECAGSMARYNGRDVYSVQFEQGGAIHGRRFLTLLEAETLFNKWIGRDVQIDAQTVRDEIAKEGI